MKLVYIGGLKQEFGGREGGVKFHVPEFVNEKTPRIVSFDITDESGAVIGQTQDVPTAAMALQYAAPANNPKARFYSVVDETAPAKPAAPAPKPTDKES